MSMNKSTIVIKGNININISLNPVDVSAVDGDDLTSQNLAALINSLLNGTDVENNSEESHADCSEQKDECKKTTAKWNINAPVFVPSKIVVDDDNDDDSVSDDEDDSDYVPDESDEESEEESEEHELDADRYNLFKTACKNMNVKGSVELFRKYLKWSTTNGKGLSRYAKMTLFLENHIIDEVAVKPVVAVAAVVKSTPVVAPAASSSTRQFNVSMSPSQESFKQLCENKGYVYSNELFNDYGLWCKRNSISIYKREAMQEYLDIYSPLKISAAAPTKKLEPVVVAPAPTKKRDQAKVDLFQDICEKYNIDYTNKLFDDYEEWAKTHGAGLNRYKKMSDFLSFRTNHKSDNGDRA